MIRVLVSLLKSRFLLFVCGSVLAVAQESGPPAQDPATPENSAVPAGSGTPIILDPLLDPPPPADFRGSVKYHLKKLVSAEAFYTVVSAAAWDQARTFPKEWGHGSIALRDRLGSEYAQFILNQSIQLAFSAVHKEDPRYFRSGQGNFFQRTGHVFKATVIVSNMNHGQTLAIGQIAGVYGSWAIASQWWEPRSEQSFGKVMLWGSVGMGTKAGGNFIREFWPDAKRKFFTHHPKGTISPAANFIP